MRSATQVMASELPTWTTQTVFGFTLQSLFSHSVWLGGISMVLRSIPSWSSSATHRPMVAITRSLLRAASNWAANSGKALPLWDATASRLDGGDQDLSPIADSPANARDRGDHAFDRRRWERIPGPFPVLVAFDLAADRCRSVRPHVRPVGKWAQHGDLLDSCQIDRQELAR